MGQSLLERAWSRLRRLTSGADATETEGVSHTAELGVDAVQSVSNQALERLAEQRGFHLVRRHYYAPVPDEADLATPGFWDQTSSLPGLSMGEGEGLRLLGEVFPPYLEEFRARYRVHEGDATSDRFFLINGVYMAVDAHVYYALVRHLKPKRVIEIGSGRSTLLALDALETNRQEDGVAGAVTAIEPYPSPFLKELAASGRLELLETKVQDVELGFFDVLASGDILFIDSTHVLREGNDVQFEYLELLPRLPDGVFVHVHDISLPRRYPKVYFDQGLYWNEQYLLQAFLAFNWRFEVVWAGNHLLLSFPDQMHAAFPEIAVMRETYPLSEPSAFWMRTKATEESRR
jgi:hypothetical protein